MSDITRTRMTLQEFLELPETNQIIELIDGEVVVSPPPKDDHQRVLGIAFRHVASIAPGGELRLAPTGLQLDQENFVEPDIFWVRGEESRCHLGEDGYWHGAPDLVIEILSPGTARRDKTTKFKLYEQHGVREYWMAAPDAEYIEVWRLESDRFAQSGVFGPGDAFASAVLGQNVDVSALFQS